MSYLATFDRIGRNHDVGPLAVSGDADSIAEQVYRYALGRLGSRDVDVTVDLGELTGTIFAGMHVAGRFTLEAQAAEAQPVSAPEPPSVHAQAKEDARQMWRAAFGTDPS